MDIYCADVGSVAKGNFGWASLKEGDDALPHESDDIEALAGSVTDSLSRGRKVALGFECPLYLPLYDVPEQITRARQIDGNRAWSAAAGLGALAMGLVEATWVLDRVHQAVPEPCHLEWADFVDADRGLFLWEAFVSGSAKTKTNSGDAARAVIAFKEEAAKGFAVPEDDIEVLSLIGAALLRTGWSRDLELLGRSCVVVKPR